MKKYDSYKDSGVEWIGEIPSHWDFYNLKFILREGVKDGPHETPIWFEEGIPFLSIDGIVNGEISFEKCRYIDEQQFEQFSKKLIIEKDDIFIGKAASIGKIARVKTDRKFTVWSPIAVIKVKKEFNPTFVEYYFRSDVLQHQIELLSTSNTQKNIAMGDIPKMKFIAPTEEEQIVIANFLDHKTTQIDHLIAKKEQFIQLLEEERVAVINQAVTKGLDPNVSMKDSGIEWLGEIPEHWEVKKLKFLLKETKDSLKTGPFGSHIKNSDYIPNGNYKVYTQRNVLDNEYEIGFECISDEKYNELKGFTIYEGDVLITTRGSIGRCSVFPNNMSIGILHPCLIRIQVNENRCLRNWVVNYINNTSLFYNNVKFNSNSTIIDVIYGYTLKEIFFPTPPIDEQHTILDFLSCTISDIDIIISKTQQEIEILKEYKTALISEVVTGKVDVRNEKLN